MLTLNFTPFPTLETERLILRQLQPEDDVALFRLRSDDRVNKYLDRAKATSVEDVRLFIEKINTAIRNNETIYWAITLKNDALVIGTITLWNISEEHNKAEVGYELNPDFQGRGLMQEALKKVITFGFSTIKLQSIEAFTAKGNSKSTSLLEKNNFQRDYNLEKEFSVKEDFKGMVIYSLSKNLQSTPS